MSSRLRRFGLRTPFLLTFTFIALSGRAQTSDSAPAASPQQPQTQTPSSTGTSVQERVRQRKAQRIAALEKEIYSHKYEAYVGGGYLRFVAGDDLQHNNEVEWNVGITSYLKDKWGVTADARGLYGTTYTYNNPYNVYNPSIYQYSIMAGPQYRFKAKPRYALSGRVLVGAIYGNFDGDTRGIGSKLLGLYSNGTAVAVNLGVPADYNLTPSFAMRVVPEYFLTTFGSTVQNNLGFTAAVVYRFGKR